MNPLPKNPSTPKVIVVGGGSSVTPHSHSIPSLSGQIAENQLPERLRAQGDYEASNADNQLENGPWTALQLTANMPSSSHWICQTLRSSVTETVHVVQIAHDVATGQAFKRTLDVTTWSAWQEYTLV